VDLIGLFLIFVGAGIIALIAWGTVSRNQWGINFGRVACPRCLHRIPNPGGPRGWMQRLFGGGRCAECKTLVTKWGREIMPSHRDRIKAQKNKAQKAARN
jgi:hypothetical protein